LSSSKKHLGGALVCSFSLSFPSIDLILPKREKRQGRHVHAPELADALLGALVSPGPIQSMDDRATIRSLFDFRWVIAMYDGAVPLEFWAARCVRRYYLHWKLSPETLALWENVSSARFPHCVL
jgi:hypothetical protein